MEFIEFNGREFSDEILVEAGGFIVIAFEDERHVRIHISAWEIDGEGFDLFLVKENDVLEDRFRETGAYYSERGISEFENQYSFDFKHKRCLILSNVRAQSRDKLIKVHLIRIKPSELTGPSYERKSQPKEEAKSQESSTRNIHWFNFGVFIFILVIILVLACLLYLVHPFLGGGFLTIIGIVLAILRKDVREYLGLESEQK